MNCPHCNDTGDMLGDGYLDCVHCDAAEILAKAKSVPAFPATPDQWGNVAQGMTLRDYFAAKAIATLNIAAVAPEMAAEQAYKIADAMLKARSA